MNETILSLKTNRVQNIMNKTSDKSKEGIKRMKRRELFL